MRRPVSIDVLLVSDLFVALTRPPMIMGVTADYLAVSGMISLCGFILFSSLICLLVYLPLHLIGFFACLYDCNIFRLISKRSMCLNVANKSIWGCQCYEPF